jgi:Icc-related predicted phosphoesterase
MRLHVVSDLHFDMRRSSWESFASKIPNDVGDVLVVAGDALCMNDIAAREMLRSLRAKAKDVVYVLGNHEYFHGIFDDTKEIAADVCKAVGVHLLDGSAKEVGGRRFIGGTMWFPRDEAALRFRHQMMDFQLIEAFEDHVYDENLLQVEYLRQNIRREDIVVTHHLPAWGSVATQYRLPPNSTLNPFFVCDCQDIIETRQPTLWIHGHTHSPCDYHIGATRVVCNPIGFPREGVPERLGFSVDV